MIFIDTVYDPYNTQLGRLTIKMNSGLPAITSAPDVILANLSTVSSVTVQGELPQNTQFGIPAHDRTTVLYTNIDKSRAAKAAIIQKIAKDTAGTASSTPGLQDFTRAITINTTVSGGPSNG